MEEKTITLTEAELQAKIDEATQNIVSKHNGEMANLRTKHAAEIEKVKKEANMSAEELARQKAEQQAQETEQELKDLRTFKKTTILKDKLAKNGLPEYFINDSRLLSAEDGELDKVIKTVKTEYEATMPKGNTKSTVVQVGGTTPQGDSKDVAFKKMADAIGQIVK